MTQKLVRRKRCDRIVHKNGIHQKCERLAILTWNQERIKHDSRKAKETRVFHSKRFVIVYIKNADKLTACWDKSIFSITVSSYLFLIDTENSKLV